ncbi:hypothetical protein CCP3SC1_1010008 [Gammaproteobacteria bacterium]
MALTPAELLLLQAALFPGPTTDAWLKQTVLEDIAPAEHAVLALLAHNSQTMGIPIPVKLVGLRRRTWYANQFQFDALAIILRALSQANIDVLVLGDAALSLWIYPEPSTRPVATLEILIRPEQLDTVRDVLRNCGWVLSPSDARFGMIIPPAEISFIRWHNNKKQLLTLHWRAFPQFPSAAIDAELWARARMSTFGELTMRTLAPTDQFVLTIQLHSLRYLLDAAVIAKTQSLHWEQILRLTIQTATPALAETFNDLHAIAESLVPAEIQRYAWTLPISKLEHWAYSAQSRSSLSATLRQLGVRHWIKYSRLCTALGRHPSITSFLDFLQYTWGKHNRYQILRYVLTYWRNKHHE